MDLSIMYVIYDGHIATYSRDKSKSETRSVSLTLCDPKNYTVHGLLQARVLV